MAVTFLPSIIKSMDDETMPFYQLVNVPQLMERQRCQFCRWFHWQRNDHTYDDCWVSHGCGTESMLWLMLRDWGFGQSVEDPVFTPTYKSKQILLDGAPRFLHLYTFNKPGYNCNTACFYYAERLSKKQTVKACSNLKRCGRNGSLFQLLHPDDSWFFNCADFTTPPASLSSWITKAGTPIDLAALDNPVSRGTNVVFNGPGANLTLIVNYIPYSKYCGNILKSGGNVDPTTWNFNTYQYTGHSINYVPVINPRDPLATLLKSLGVPDSVFV